MMINFSSLRIVFSEEDGTTYSKKEVSNIGLSKQGNLLVRRSYTLWFWLYGVFTRQQYFSVYFCQVSKMNS